MLCGLLVAGAVCLGDAAMWFTTDSEHRRGHLTPVVTAPGGKQLADGQLGHISAITDTSSHLVLVIPSCPWQQDIQDGPWQRRCIYAHSQHDQFLAVLTPQAIANLPKLTAEDKQSLESGNVIALTQGGASREVEIVGLVSTKTTGDNWPSGYQVTSQQRRSLRQSSLRNAHIAGYRYAIAQHALPDNVDVAATHTVVSSDADQVIQRPHARWLHTVVAATILGVFAALVAENLQLSQAFKRIVGRRTRQTLSGDHV